MKLIPRDSRHGISIFRLALTLTIAALVPLLAYASAPAWWSQRGVLVQNGTADDYALVNQGQLKNIALAAVLEMDARLPGGAGNTLHALVDAWASPTAQTNDYAPVNLGQLKNIAKPFYDRLIAAGLADAYPWSGSSNQPDDFALANIGQVKKLFSFDLPNPDSDGNGLLDAWELQHFGHLGVDPNADPDGDGFTNLQEYQNATDPNDFYNGATPQLVLLAGDGQTVRTDSNAPRAFELLVLKTDGTPLPNAPVTFAVTSGDGLLTSDATPGAPLFGSMTVRADYSGRVRPPVATVLYHASSSPGLAVVQASAQSAVAQFSVTVTTDGPLEAPTLLSATLNSVDGSTLFEWSLPPSGIPATSSIALLGRAAGGVWQTIASLSSSTISYSAVPNEIAPFVQFALRVFPEGNGNPSPLSNILGGSSGLPAYAVIELGTGRRPLAVASDGTVALYDGLYYRKRGQVEEVLDGSFGIQDMNDLGDIAGAKSENGGYTAYAILASNPASVLTRWAGAGHGGASYLATSLQKINEKRRVTGDEYMTQTAGPLRFTSGTTFISTAPLSLNTIASWSYTYNISSEVRTGETGTNYSFRDLDNHGRGVGRQTDIATNTETPLYFGFGSGPGPSGDNAFNPIALNDDGLVLGFSNNGVRLWEPLTGRFRTLALPNSLDWDSSLRVTDPLESDPDKKVLILAGNNVVFRTWKDADGYPSVFPIYTTRGAADLLPSNSPFYDLNFQNISNNGIIVATARKVGDEFEHAIMLMPVELKKVWETQNKANQIYNPTQKDDPWGGGYGGYGTEQNGAPRNKLFLLPDPESNKYKATIEVDIPQDFRANFYGAAYVGDTKVANSDKAFTTEGKCELEFEHLGTSNDIQDFAIRIGYDANNSETLDPEEVSNLAVKDYGEPIVRGTKASKYDSSKGAIDNVVGGFVVGDWFGLLPHARNFLRIFRDGHTGGVPVDKRPTSSSSISFIAFDGYFAEWLTHNSGAAFGDDGAAQLTEYSWNIFTSAADLIATSPQIRDAVSNYYGSVVAPLADAHFASLPVGSSAFFPSTGFYDIPHTHESPAWVPLTTVTFDGFAPDQVDDVNGTIGRGRLISHTARYRVEKLLIDEGPPGEPYFVERLVVTEVVSEGAVIDLYDFNHMVEGFAQDAAILQIGYGKGAYGGARDRGKIFRNRIQFSKTHTSLP